jgi:hypothetical protein
MEKVTKVRLLRGNLFTRKVGNKMIFVGIIDHPDDSKIPSEAMHRFFGDPLLLTVV